MNLISTTLIKEVYSQRKNINSNFSLEKFLNTKNIRYYSLGRYALVSALNVLQVGEGDTVAFPEFICRDLIASVYKVGAKVKFYPVDENLNLACTAENFPLSKVIVAVNYFGFPQELAVFNQIADKMGAILIEDNAHGFLSTDTTGRPLGTRTKIGLFSLRKTMLLFNGAALFVNDHKLAQSLANQLPSNANGRSVTLWLKGCLRSLTPVFGVKPCRMLTNFTRLIRKIRTGEAIPKPDPDAEKLIPGSPLPYSNLISDLSCLDVSSEVARRRKLYLQLDNKIREHGGLPVFDELQDGVAPYVFPFRADDINLVKIQQYLKTINLDCHLWPDLPDIIAPIAKSHYRNVLMVPFLW